MHTLSELAPGTSAIVDELLLSEADALRLMELGFIPGSTVSCQRRVPLGDLSVYQLDGAQITLRRETAARICVRSEARSGRGDGGRD